jgi:hypothetical protein
MIIGRRCLFIARIVSRVDLTRHRSSCHSKSGKEVVVYRFNIVLQGAGETAFFKSMMKEK